MRKLKLQMQLSVDGFVASPKHEMDWMTWDWDDALKNYVAELTKPFDTIIMGRVLAQGFIPSWEGRIADPATADEFGHKMVDTTKIVFSKTLRSVAGKNAVINNKDLVEEVTALKHSKGGDIMTYGGASFAAALIENELVDELHLFVNPAAIGEGLRIFTGRTNLSVVKSTAFDCGIIVNVYAPKK